MRPKSFAKDLGITQEVRGLSSSIVENAVKYGSKVLSTKTSDPRYLYTYDDVTVVTDITSKVIISFGKRTK